MAIGDASIDDVNQRFLSNVFRDETVQGKRTCNPYLRVLTSSLKRIADISSPRCIFTGVITLALWLPATGNAPIILFAALFGFGSGAFVSLLPSMLAQISDVRQIGVRTGTVFAIISIAALISNPIGGAIITRWHGSYTGLQIFAGVMCTGG